MANRPFGVLIATGDLAYGLAAAAIPALLLWYTSCGDIQDSFVTGYLTERRVSHVDASMSRMQRSTAPAQSTRAMRAA